MSRITTEDLIGEVEYIIGQIEAGIKERGWIKLDFNADDLTKFQAIRKHLEKQTVSREELIELILKYEGKSTFEMMRELLTEFGIRIEEE